ncbi:MAG TPA: hypothetical protein VFJ85_01195 [Acidimicrobiales bacterium]|nr:hypothetical protein [Acidimicrobiales bacterium]
MDDRTAVLSRLLDAEVDRRVAWLAAHAERWLVTGERLPDQLAALADHDLHPAASQ